MLTCNYNQRTVGKNNVFMNIVVYLETLDKIDTCSISLRKNNSYFISVINLRIVKSKIKRHRLYSKYVYKYYIFIHMYV